MFDNLKSKPNRTERKFFESLESHLTDADHVILNLTKVKKHAPDLYQKAIKYVEKHKNAANVIDVTR